MTRVSLVVFIIAVVVILALGIVLFSAYGRTKASEQPIAFSHKVHAGDFKIACEYCHSYARRSTVAGIPSVARCLGCHKITALDKPEVKKLVDYWNRKEAIPWLKVTRMPDFVYFEHWLHVRAEIACQTCHGPVETMVAAEQVKDLTMADCLACHREQKASLDCVVCHR